MPPNSLLPDDTTNPGSNYLLVENTTELRRVTVELYEEPEGAEAITIKFVPRGIPQSALND
jgi:hypothetical protein